MGGLKITGFLKTEEVSSSGWATWRVGVRKPKKAFMTSRRLWVFLSRVSFQWWRSCPSGFPRSCPPINSVLFLLFSFFLLHFPESSFFFFSLLLLPLLLWVKNFKRSFVPVISYHDIYLLLVILYRDSNLSSLELYLVRASLLLSFLLLRLLVHWTWFLVCFRQVACDCCWMLAFCWCSGSFFRVFFLTVLGLGFVSFLGCLCLTVALFACRLWFIFERRNVWQENCFICPG